MQKKERKKLYFKNQSFEKGFYFITLKKSKKQGHRPQKKKNKKQAKM